MVEATFTQNFANPVSRVSKRAIDAPAWSAVVCGKAARMTPKHRTQLPGCGAADLERSEDCA